MSKKISLFFAFLSFGIVSIAQTYSGPESVEYDVVGDRWLVSNTTSHEIIARSNSGALTVFASGLVSGPHGLEIVGNTLYACSGGSLKGFDLSTGSQTVNVNLGGSFLNGITHRGTDLFITDFSNKEIIRFNTLNNSFNDFITGLTKTPNGIIYDDINDRLVMVNWGTNAPIIGINISDSTYATLATTTLGNCDGIAMNCSGQFYVASWSPNRISRFDNDFVSAPVNMNVTGLSSPADIFYNQVEDTLGIPNSGNSTVKFVQYNDCSTQSIDEEMGTIFNIFPNPANEMIFIQSEKENSQMIISDQVGKIIANEKMISNSHSFDVSQLPSGIYFITIDNFTQKLLIQR